MTEYKVLKPLEHDGKPYLPGSRIKLKKENALYLLRIGVIGKANSQEDLPTELAEDIDKDKEHKA